MTGFGKIARVPTAMKEQWIQEANALAKQALQQGLVLKTDRIDHLALHCFSLACYQQTKEELSVTATLLCEANINGRPIATFRFPDSFAIGHDCVNVVELMAPKIETGADGVCFDHIEVVIHEPFALRKARHSQLCWQPVRWPSVVNPELVVSFENKTIKFHHTSLEHVIAVEHQFPHLLKQRVPPPQSFKTWIFDLDGTLVQSEKSVARGVQCFLQQKGFTHSDDEIEKAMRTTYNEFFSALGHDFPSKTDDLKHFVECEASAAVDCATIAVVNELFHQVVAAGCRVWVWTARYEPAAKKILSDLGLLGQIERVITSSDVAKPSVLKDLGNVTPHDIIVVGDSETDRQAAIQNGFSFLQVVKF